MKIKLLGLFFMLYSLQLFAQKHTISGYVEDAETGERLLGASVYNLKAPQQGTITNHYGFFSLAIPKAEVELVFSFVGYATQTKSMNLVQNEKLTIQLSSNNQLDEVVVRAKRKEVESAQMSRVDVPIELIRKMPAFLGEVDILKTIQLLPGVQGGTEGTSGIYVRGGGPDQNLILLDGVPVYNASHLFGFFSVFNSSAISDVSLTKGGFPARYGGRLSSVLDIRMKEGNTKKLKGEVDIGIISSKLTLEGPIVKDKTSFIISGRRTYIDILAAPFVRRESEGAAKAGYYFYDINAKVNHKFSDRDRLYLSFYTGLDKAYSKISGDSNDNEQNNQLNFSLDWGNYTTALRWNHVFSPQLFGNTTITYSQYRLNTDINEKHYERDDEGKLQPSSAGIKYFSGINDLAAKIDFEYSPSPKHSVKFGVSSIYHTFKPGVTSLKYDGAGDEKFNFSFGDKKLNTVELDAYVEDEIRFTDRLTANLGIHGSSFSVRDTTFFSIQPRVSLRFLASEVWSFKLSYAEMQQNLHLLTSSSIGLPTDLWLPATNVVKPQQSKQIAAGSVVELSDAFNLSIESFYKDMSNLIEYREGASFFDGFGELDTNGSSWERKVTQGKGWAYGLEVLLKKDLGKLRGWVGYTLSWTERQFNEISFGKVFPYRYDRRHDINVLLTYKLNDKVNFAATWVYGTGNAVTLATQTHAGLEELDNAKNGVAGKANVSHYETRNNYRMPAYHRLDLGINVSKKKKHGFQTWSFGVYNAYNRKNPFFLNWDSKNEGGQEKKELVQYSLFPIIPSVSYKYKF